MRVRKALAGFAALSLVAAPIAATAAPAARAASPVEGEQLADSGFAWGIAAIFVVVLGILVFSDGDEEPVSP